jgi:poly-gamma-glutamate capsule biosynthesis protein CapA/YwtB (metallophosphatase superfamily)
MLGRGIDQAAGRSEDWQPFAQLTPVIDQADILAANLESPLTDAPAVSSGYMLCAPPKRVEALKAASFDLLTVANNHIFDCGTEGSQQTLSILRSAGITSAGPGIEPVYLPVKGRNLAFIALDDVTRPVDESRAEEAIRQAARRSDLVILSIHWGSEYQPAPSSRQRALARQLVQAGADIIIGHHPHVIQPLERISRASDKFDALVFYSLGNALFDQHGLPDTRRGAGVTLILGADGIPRFSVFTFEIDPGRGLITGFLPDTTTDVIKNQ